MGLSVSGQSVTRPRFIDTLPFNMEERDSPPIEASEPVDGSDPAPATADDDGPPGTEPTPAHAGGSPACAPAHEESGAHATDADNHSSEPERGSGQKRAGEDIERDDHASKVAKEEPDEPGIPGVLPPRVKDALRQLYESGRVWVVCSLVWLDIP